MNVAIAAHTNTDSSRYLPVFRRADPVVITNHHTAMVGGSNGNNGNIVRTKANGISECREKRLKVWAKAYNF